MKKNKATKLLEIPKVIDKNLLVGKDDGFFVDLHSLRKDFEQSVYSHLGVNHKTYKMHDENDNLQRQIFLLSFRGSGKTTFLHKVEQSLLECGDYYPIFCDARELNASPQAIDLVFLQTLSLLKILQKEGISKELLEDGENALFSWSEETVRKTEENKSWFVNTEAGATGEIGLFVKLFAKISSSVQFGGSESNLIRQTFQTNFGDFSLKLNEFFTDVTNILKEKKKIKKCIFIIDGFEKIIAGNNVEAFLRDIENYFQELKIDIIFSFPIEAIDNHMNIQGFSRVSFPFIRVKEYEGVMVSDATNKYKEIVYNRINKDLFENDALVETFVEYSGGSIRQLFEIIYECWIWVEDKENGQITEKSWEKARKKLEGLYMSSSMRNRIWDKFLELERYAKDKKNKVLEKDEIFSDMIKSRLIFDYNEGTTYEANPLIRNTEKYKNLILNKV